MLTRGKVERAFLAAVAALPEYPAGLTLRSGASADETDLPMVSIDAGSPKEDPDPSGNYHVPVRIMILSSADRQEPLEDPVAEHDTRVATLLGAIKERAARSRGEPTSSGVDESEDPCLAQRLSDAEPDFYVFDGIEDMGGDPALNGRAFTDSLVLSVYCTDADITD